MRNCEALKNSRLWDLSAFPHYPLNRLCHIAIVTIICIQTIRMCFLFNISEVHCTLIQFINCHSEIKDWMAENFHALYTDQQSSFLRKSQTSRLNPTRPSDDLKCRSDAVNFCSKRRKLSSKLQSHEKLIQKTATTGQEPNPFTGYIKRLSLRGCFTSSRNRFINYIHTYTYIFLRTLIAQLGGPITGQRGGFFIALAAFKIL